jgi:hypothetical protein
MTIRLLIPKLVFAAACIAAISSHAQLLYVTNADGVSVTITGYTNAVPSAIIIPTNIHGLTVTAIGGGAFAAMPNLTSVIIPATVTTIGEVAFNDSGLTNVTIPYGVTNIGEGAFDGCESLTNAAIPESVTAIGQGAFSDTGLLTVTIPGSVTVPGNGAFDVGESLTDIIIEPGIASLGQGGVIGGNPNLPTVTIPATVTNIQDSAFRGCPTLAQAFFMGNAPAVDNTSFVSEYQGPPPTFQDIPFYVTTAYYLPGTTGWAEFSSNTVITPSDFPTLTTNISVPTVMWNPTIQATGTNFGIQNGQYGFDVTAPTNLPIAIEACDDLTESNWVVLQRLTLTNGLFHFSEPFVSTNAARFYRIGFP